MSEALSLVSVVVSIDGGVVVMLSLLEAVLLVSVFVVAVVVVDGVVGMLEPVDVEGVVMLVVPVVVPTGEVGSGSDGCVDCCRCAIHNAFELASGKAAAGS